MSRSELHDWECAIEKLCGDNADKMLAIAQDIYNTAFARGKNYMLSDKTRWISVSERLPEKNIEVLVTTKWDYITIGEMFGDNDWFIHEGTTNADIDDIKAWMPLPTPYKAESEEV